MFFYPTCQTVRWTVSWVGFFYYGKSWCSKKLPFANAKMLLASSPSEKRFFTSNVKNFSHLQMNIFCYFHFCQCRRNIFRIANPITYRILKWKIHNASRELKWSNTMHQAEFWIVLTQVGLPQYVMAGKWGMKNMDYSIIKPYRIADPMNTES